MVKVIHESDFEEVAQSPLALLDFSATWCGPCRMVAPVLEKLSEQLEGKMDFFSADVDETPNLAAQFSVHSIPALVILRNGKEVGREVGFKPEMVLKSILEGYCD